MTVLAVEMTSFVIAVSMCSCELMSVRMFINSLVGTLGYMLAMSSEANFVLSSMGVFSMSSIRCIELLMLQAYGGETCISVSLESNFANLWAGVFRLLTVGLMGMSSLWILERPFMFGAVGLRLTYFHLSSLRIVWLQLLIVWLQLLITFRSSFWKPLVWSFCVFEKLMLRMNSCVLEFCFSVYQITMVFVLSALSIVALFSCGFFLMLLMVCISVWVFFVCGGSYYCYIVYTVVLHCVLSCILCSLVLSFVGVTRWFRLPAQDKHDGEPGTVPKTHHQQLRHHNLPAEK